MSVLLRFPKRSHEAVIQDFITILVLALMCNSGSDCPMVYPWHFESDQTWAEAIEEAI